MITSYGTDTERQDSCFYADGSGSMVAWSITGCDYYVVASGVMDIRYTDPDGTEHRIYDTGTLDKLGFDTDSKVAEMSDKGEEIWSWVNNNWFEVYSDTDLDYFSEPIDTIDNAIYHALELAQKSIPLGMVEEPDVVY